MDLSKLPLFAAMSRRMSWLGQRQEVLAQSVANADTPGYRAQDLKEPSFGDLIRNAPGARLQMAATSSGHLGGAKPGPSKPEKVADAEKLISGNAVSLEDEMMKVAKTAMDFQLTTNLYRKHVAMIKTALGRGGM